MNNVKCSPSHIVKLHNWVGQSRPNHPVMLYTNKQYNSSHFIAIASIEQPFGIFGTATPTCVFMTLVLNIPCRESSAPNLKWILTSMTTLSASQDETIPLWTSLQMLNSVTQALMVSVASTTWQSRPKYYTQMSDQFHVETVHCIANWIQQGLATWQEQAVLEEMDHQARILMAVKRLIRALRGFIGGRNDVLICIPILESNLDHVLRIWAENRYKVKKVVCLQSSVRKAAMDPSYPLCCMRLMREWNEWNEWKN